MGLFIAVAACFLAQEALVSQGVIFVFDTVLFVMSPSQKDEHGREAPTPKQRNQNTGCTQIDEETPNWPVEENTQKKSSSTIIVRVCY